MLTDTPIDGTTCRKHMGFLTVKINVNFYSNGNKT